MIRIGVLGAAKITQTALLGPAALVDGVAVTAIAARDVDRARRYARKHSIPTVYRDYKELLASPDVDAVYVPLPAALHGKWVRAALAAGKHVLVEKPFAANEIEATLLEGLASSSTRVVMEAYHTGHHPLMARLKAILDSGELGRMRSANAVFCVPIPPGKDIRWNPALGGGGLLDVGYYPVRVLRDLFGAEPRVLEARATTRGAIDASLEGTLAFDDGMTGTVTSSIWSRRLFAARLDVTGSEGSLRVTSPYHPQMSGSVSITTRAGRRRETADRRSTYLYQLEAFRDAVEHGGPNVTDARSAVAQLAVIDDLYRAAGMTPRAPSSAS